VLGVLNPRQIAGGAVEIFADLATRALRDHVAAKLGLSLQEAAFGVLEIADATIMRALRAVTVERGRDPREVTLIAYGGGGPLHAARLATMLGTKRVVIPPLPGLFSALGLLVSGYRYDASRSLLIKAEDLDGEIIDRYSAELESTVREGLNRDGVRLGSVTLWREADMRYRTGNAVLTLSLGSSTNQLSLDVIVSEFVNRHRIAYGFVMDSPVDVVAIRVRAEAVSSVPQLGQLARLAGTAVTADASTAVQGDRDVYFGKRVGTLPARVLVGRSSLAAEEHGPLIIEEPDTTILVPPGWMISPFHSHSLLMKSEVPARRND
jgi:N-methylhydantoinase A